jgi:hypothetical protein
MRPTILSYPGGRCGLGLLLLRVAASGALLVAGAGYSAGPPSWSWAIGLAALASAIMLLAGALTSLAGALGAIAAAATLVPWSSAAAPTGLAWLPSAWLTAAVAAALALAGPGVYSLDARLFGHREIVIPHSPRAER